MFNLWGGSLIKAYFTITFRFEFRFRIRNTVAVEILVVCIVNNANSYDFLQVLLISKKIRYYKSHRC